MIVASKNLDELEINENSKKQSPSSRFRTFPSNSFIYWFFLKLQLLCKFHFCKILKNVSPWHCVKSGRVDSLDTVADSVAKYENCLLCKNWPNFDQNVLLQMMVLNMSPGTWTRLCPICKSVWTLIGPQVLSWDLFSYTHYFGGGDCLKCFEHCI